VDIPCPECGKGLHVKVGKNGPFIACSGYPECRYSSDYVRDDRGRIQPVDPSRGEPTDKVCDKCGRPMVIRQGRYGTFLSCSGYPECANAQSLSSDAASARTGVKCPQPDCSGDILEKKSKRGKFFYGCSRYPDCTFAIWDKPVPVPCPTCGASFLAEKSSKKRGTYLTCLTQGCGFTMEKPEEEPKNT
jgi:DNA topoisomerase-1